MNEPVEGNVYLAAAAMQQAAFLVLSAPMGALVAESVEDQRFILTVLVVTACLALVMSAAGIYGVISYATSRRTQEIGIRVAVGATSTDVRLLIFRQGFATVATGLVIGIAAAVPILRLLEGSLVGVESRHTASLFVSIAVVLVTAGFARWFPARRATLIDPLAALRQG